MAHPDQRAVGRIRRPSGGRQRVEKKCPHILVALEDLLRDAVAGDPMSGMRWTHKSIRKLCAALRKRGLPVGHGTLARLLKEQRFSLRTNRKRLAGTGDPDRDRQFRYLARVRRWYLTRGLPVISEDAKKKELIGPFNVDLPPKTLPRLLRPGAWGEPVPLDGIGSSVPGGPPVARLLDNCRTIRSRSSSNPLA